MSNPNFYPAKHPIWAVLLSASISLTSLGVQKGSGADSLNSHKLDPGYCIPNVESASNGTHVGPSVNTLANIIAEIRRGQPVEVMSRPVSLTEAGIPSGKGLPIVFEIKGNECLAFNLDFPETQSAQITPYKEAQSIYVTIPEPAVDKNIPLVEATQVSGELGVIETQNGLIAGWSDTKYTAADCTFSSCPTNQQLAQ